MTIDHERTRERRGERDLWPAAAKSTHSDGDRGLVRIDSPDLSAGDSLENVSWDEWFEKFDHSDLVLLHQRKSSGGGVPGIREKTARLIAARSGLVPELD